MYDQPAIIKTCACFRRRCSYNGDPGLCKTLLLPLTFAGLLSMLLLPLVKWLPKKNVPHVLAILLGILVLIAFFAAVIFFTSFQIADIGQNSARLEQQVNEKYHSVRQYIAQTLGI